MSRNCYKFILIISLISHNKLFSLTNNHRVRPSWVLNHLPNGIPEQLHRYMQFLENPEPFIKVGASMPRGVLLYGPPGTGKTSIVRAMADAAKTAFISASGTEFTAKTYGAGVEKIREFFAEARLQAKNHPSKKVIVFIDELDVIAALRGSREGHGCSEQLTELLNQLDGFKKDESLYFVGATNRLSIIDPALMRPGRLAALVNIGLPSEEERIHILRFYFAKIKYEGPDIVPVLAKLTKQKSGADLKAMVNEAALLAGQENAGAVRREHFCNIQSNNMFLQKIKNFLGYFVPSKL